MKKLRLVLICGMCAFGSVSQAIPTVSLEPNPQTIVGVGGNAFIAVVISGLGNFTAPSLGGFDFDLSYDSSIISAASLVFGSYLDLGILGSAQFSDLSTAGSIHLDEVSFEDPIDLNASQPGMFTLATIGFTGLALGSSSLAFTYAALSDQDGGSISEFGTLNTSITVVASSAVPESGSTFPLLVLGFVSLVTLRWVGWGLKLEPAL